VFCLCLLVFCLVVCKWLSALVFCLHLASVCLWFASDYECLCFACVCSGKHSDLYLRLSLSVLLVVCKCLLSVCKCLSVFVFGLRLACVLLVVCKWLRVLVFLLVFACKTRQFRLQAEIAAIFDLKSKIALPCVKRQRLDLIRSSP